MTNKNKIRNLQTLINQTEILKNKIILNKTFWIINNITKS